MQQVYDMPSSRSSEDKEVWWRKKEDGFVGTPNSGKHSRKSRSEQKPKTNRLGSKRKEVN
jgi:hypothetical protein